MTDSLWKKAKEGKLDEVDEAMLISALKKADQEFSGLMSNFCDSLKELCEKYDKEADVLGFHIVCQAGNRKQKWVEICYGPGKLCKKAIMEMALKF